MSSTLRARLTHDSLTRKAYLQAVQLLRDGGQPSADLPVSTLQRRQALPQRAHAWRLCAWLAQRVHVRGAVHRGVSALSAMRGGVCALAAVVGALGALHVAVCGELPAQRLYLGGQLLQVPPAANRM